MDIVLFGKPGAGKGTQAPRIAAALGVPTVATGDMLRAALRAGTPMGLAAKGYMERGDLVPDEVILGIMKESLAKDEFAGGSLLDGVVRTTPQAEGMSRVLRELGRKIDAVLMFDIDDERSRGASQLARRVRAVPDAIHRARAGHTLRQVRRDADPTQGR